MATEFVESVEFTLEGDMVRMREIGGGGRSQITNIATFEANHRRASKVLAEWYARKVEPTPIGKRGKR